MDATHLDDSLMPKNFHLLCLQKMPHYFCQPMPSGEELEAYYGKHYEATIASGPVIDAIFAESPELMHKFDLVHFTCPYASKQSGVVGRSSPPARLPHAPA
jgi:hypothetical protein